MPKRIRGILSGCAAFLLLSLPGSYAAKHGAGEDLFRECVIPDVQLDIGREGMAALGGQSPRKYVRATVREGKSVYTNVAVRLKGGPGSFRPLNDLPAFTLNFDKFAPGQTFHGLKKIHLNNSVQDRSFLHEKISREIFEAAGVPVPRAGNAWVKLNDRDLGMYVLLEGVNKQFLKRYFKDASGNIYDGHSGNDVTQPMRTNSGENPRDKSRLQDLASAASEADPNRRLAALEKVLDLDRFFAFIAVELMLGHWDGYSMNRNNFRVYHDRDTDRMVFIPHGLDQTFSRTYSVFPQNSQAFMTRAVFEIPEARTRYRERYAQIVTNVFLPDWITNRLQTAAAKIDAAFERNKAGGRPNVAQAFSDRIRRRALYLRNQIAPEAAVSSIQFSGIGIAPLNNATNWFSKLDLGKAQLDRETDAKGNALLHIGSAEGCTASWRTVVQLPAGAYRFQAHIKTKGVALASGDPRAGAGLRISRHRNGQKNTGNKDWTPIAFEFEVPEEGQETELVCELRADRGEIWYDLNSIKLIRK
ncbi:MAG TPA: CotH kinase family protein [Verrucomicrobiae bacterium]|nr:CotH kinase family protein [Verrucomicrobiae bacterium]